MDIYKEASKLNLLIASVIGHLTVNDLWSLPLKTTRPNQASLNDIAISLNRELKSADEENFVDDEPTNSADKETKLAFEIVKDIIETKKAENKAERDKAEKAQKKQVLLQLLQEKQHDDLKSKSAEELKEMLEAL
jgi:translation initiation factor 2B subunit (eIF-2B alpha/beta/delta family)